MGPVVELLPIGHKFRSRVDCLAPTIPEIDRTHVTTTTADQRSAKARIPSRSGVGTLLQGMTLLFVTMILRISPVNECVILAMDIVIPVINRNTDGYPHGDLLPLPRLSPCVCHIAVAVSPFNIYIGIPVLRQTSCYLLG